MVDYFIGFTHLALHSDWTAAVPASIMEKDRPMRQFILISEAVAAKVGGGWQDRFWQSGGHWLIVYLAILAIMIALACYIIGKIRPKSVQAEHPASEWMAKYRELHSRGELSDEEFRTIKTKLAVQLQDELNDSGKSD
jgi:uncharacterized membrane protein